MMRVWRWSSTLVWMMWAVSGSRRFSSTRTMASRSCMASSLPATLSSGGQTPGRARARAAAGAGPLFSLAQLPQPPGGGLELAVLEQAGQQLVAGLLGRQLGLEQRLRAGQQQPGLDLHQEAHEQQELAHLVPVGRGPLGLHLVQVGGDDLEQRHLEQVDLLLEDEREQEVERPLVDVQV